MTRRMWPRRLLVVAGILTLSGIGWAAAGSERLDCPGKIVCPLTGKLVCKDRCPLGANNAGATDQTAKAGCSGCKKG